MSDKIIENNQVTVIGEVVSEFTYSHEVFGEGFYMVDILVKRLSSSNDRITRDGVRRGLIDVNRRITGASASWCPVSSGRTTGTRNRKTGWCCRCSRGKSSLSTRSRTGPGRITSFWKAICANARCTGRHRWGREIADLLLAVNRPYGKSDYIPCICWGSNARYASGFDVGEHVRILGRIQSRGVCEEAVED